MKDSVGKKRAIAVAMLVLIALVSVVGLSKIASDPQTYRATIQSIDEKKTAVLGLTAASAAVSTALAAVPGDATSPIANQILQLSSYLLIVVCALILEKSLLTVLGYISFTIVIPIACVLFGIYVFNRKEQLRNLAIKLAVFALVLVAIVPVSIKIGDLIYEANKSTVEAATMAAEEIESETQSQEGERNWWENLLAKIEEGVTNIGDKAHQILNNFIDAIAVFVITYCVIPIAVIFFVIWLVKLLFGITLPTPKPKELLPVSKQEKKEELPQN